MKKNRYQKPDEIIVTATEAKNKLGKIMQWVVKDGNTVVIQQHGNPVTVMIPIQTYKIIKPVIPKKKKKVKSILDFAGKYAHLYKKHPIDIDNIRDYIDYSDL